MLARRVLPPRAPSPRPPLLVLLHGYGCTEDDLLPLADRLDPRFLVVAPRAPKEVGPAGFCWYGLDWSVTPPRADLGEVLAARELLAGFLEELPGDVGAAPGGAFLLGFSQGAILSLALLLARPDLVRGVVAHSGRLSRLPPPEPAPAALARAEALLLHGEDDDVVPCDQGRKAYDVLAGVLGPRVAFRAYPGLAHAISGESLAEAARWLAARL